MNQLITQMPISSLSERIKKTPLNNSKRGYWTGQRGNSIYIPVACQIEINCLLKQFSITGITYANGIPDFQPYDNCFSRFKPCCFHTCALLNTFLSC